jgi:MFS family permease
MAFVATLNATLQLNSSDAMRGRVMALYFVLFLGSTPVGAPIIGWISQQFNPRVALGVGAIATLGSCAWAWSRLRSEWSPHSGAGSDELPEGSFEDRDERLLQEHA